GRAEPGQPALARAPVDPERHPEQCRDITEADRQQEVGREHQLSGGAAGPSAGLSAPPGSSADAASPSRGASAAAPAISAAQTPKTQTTSRGMPATVTSTR